MNISRGFLLLPLLRGLRDVFVWLLHLRIVQLVAVTATLFLLFVWTMEWGRFAPVVIPPSAKEIVSKENGRCIALAMNDEGETNRQRTYVAYANMNMAKTTGLSNCEVFRKCLTTLAPGQKSSVCSRFRTISIAELSDNVGEKSELAASIILRDEILKNPVAYIVAHPELPGLHCVDHLNRSKEPWFKGSGTDKAKMRQALGPPVYKDEHGFEAFCPKP